MEQTIKIADLFHYKNAEHIQFHSEVKTLVIGLPQATDKLKALQMGYINLNNQEDEAFLLLRKTESSETESEADAARLTVMRGFSKAVSSMLNFPNAEKKAAATHIKMMIDGYDLNSSKLTSNKTSSINKLIKDLQTNHANDVALLGLGDWLAELIAKQTDYEYVTSQGYTEKAQKTLLRMKEVRVEIDMVYRALIKHVDALIEVNGIEGFDSFVKQLNVRIDKYNNVVSQRKGRNAKDDETPKTPKQ